MLHGVLNQLLSVPLNKLKYGKFTIVYTMSESLESDGKITYTLGPSISLLSPTTNSVGIDYSVIASIIRQVLSAQELYGTNVLSSLSLNIYYELKRANMKIRFEDNDDLKLDKLISIVMNMIKPMDKDSSKPPQVTRRVSHSRQGGLPRSDVIPTQSLSDKPPKKFIVADLETVLVNDVHVPYAAGFVVVTPDIDIESISPEEYNIHIADGWVLSKKEVIIFLTCST